MCMHKADARFLDFPLNVASVGSSFARKNRHHGIKSPSENVFKDAPDTATLRPALDLSVVHGSLAVHCGALSRTALNF